MAVVKIKLEEELGPVEFKVKQSHLFPLNSPLGTPSFCGKVKKDGPSQVWDERVERICPECVAYFRGFKEGYRRWA